MKKKLGLLITLAALASFSLSQAAPAENLLQNGDFSDSQDQYVSRWVFPLSPLKALGAGAESVLRGTELDKAGNRFLTITTTAQIKAHVWWQQEIEVQGGSSYTFSVRLAADVKPSDDGNQTYQSPDIGIYFYDATGKWMGYLPVPVPQGFTSNWQTVTMKVTAPDNAIKIGVRLGISASAKIKARFDDAVLTLSN